jgi:hypothetical protein
LRFEYVFFESWVEVASVFGFLLYIYVPMLPPSYH